MTRRDWTSDSPVLEAAMVGGAPPTWRAVRDVPAELDDVLVRVRPVVAVLERSGGDIPPLAAIPQRVPGELVERMRATLSRAGASR